MGVGRLLGPGTSTQDIAVYIRDWFGEQGGNAITKHVPSIDRTSRAHQNSNVRKSSRAATRKIAKPLGRAKPATSRKPKTRTKPARVKARIAKAARRKARR
jgi:hypothetical protein